MDSGITCDSNGDLNSRVRSRWTETIKVYARKKFRKQAPNPSCNNDTATTSDGNSTVASETKNPNTNTADWKPDHGSHTETTQSLENIDGDCAVQDSVEDLAAYDADDLPRYAPNCDKVGIFEREKPTEHSTGILGESLGEKVSNLRSSPLSTVNDNPDVTDERVEIVDEPQHEEPESVNGIVRAVVMSRFDDKVRYNLFKAGPVNEIVELRMKLEYELDQVRRTVKQLEAKEHQLATCNNQINGSDHFGVEFDNVGGYNNVQSHQGYPNDVQSHQGHTNNVHQARIDVVDNTTLMSLNSEVVHRQPRPLGLDRVYSDMGAVQNVSARPYSRQLSVAVMENNDLMEKEKRTPKANQYYRNSEFLLSKDRLPPESNKRLKMSNGRRHNVNSDHGFGFKNQVLKSCTSLLQRLMKHKHGWVFNEPVDAEALRLADYHFVIRHPMDLGTIKTRLSQNRYKSPTEFAEDVRLVFHNAMTYNPKGQDVHVMAEQLLQIFEERWAIIETECNPQWRYPLYQNSPKVPQSHFVPHSAPTYVPAHAAVSVPLYPPQMRALDIPINNMAVQMAMDPKIQRPYVPRTPAPKKPKAKDLNKRDMTYEEKQKLSSTLQALPAERLDQVVKIMKRANSTLSQHDDEIEVDIDKIDPETLWELDRFVVNYKKSLSKYKRKAELALQARAAANQNGALTDMSPALANVHSENRTGLEKSVATPAGEESDMHELNGNKSSSSSSSSSGSGSSSSDSDSDSSSADGSDAGNSPHS